MDQILHSKLEKTDSIYKDKHFVVRSETNEFTAVCPISGMPDIYDLSIQYVPKDSLVELKSLKFYLFQYRNVGMFVEHITNKIADDFYKVIEPHFVLVEIVQAIRGGIRTIVKVSRGSMPEKDNQFVETGFDTME